MEFYLWGTETRDIFVYKPCVRDGLNNVQNQLEEQGKALEGQISNVKSELEGAHQPQIVLCSISYNRIKCLL